MAETRTNKILVVDDDRTTLEMLQTRLDVAGFHCIPVRSGEAALEILAASRPDALVLERNLPGMDGMDILEALAALYPVRPIPVLLVGRNLAAEDLRRGMALGVRDCLAKPLSGAAALERIGRMLKKSDAAHRQAVVS